MDFILEAFTRIIECIAFYGFIVFRIKLHGTNKGKGSKSMHFFDIVIVVVIVDLQFLTDVEEKGIIGIWNLVLDFIVSEFIFIDTFLW